MKELDKIQKIFHLCVERAQNLVRLLKENPNSEILPRQLQTFYIGLRNYLALTANKPNDTVNKKNDATNQIKEKSFDIFQSHQILFDLCEEISALGQKELEKLSGKIVSIRKEKIRLNKFKSTRQASASLSDAV